jgi:hypothetical protein
MAHAVGELRWRYVFEGARPPFAMNDRGLARKAKCPCQRGSPIQWIFLHDPAFPDRHPDRVVERGGDLRAHTMTGRFAVNAVQSMSDDRPFDGDDVDYRVDEFVLGRRQDSRKGTGKASVGHTLEARRFAEGRDHERTIRQTCRSATARAGRIHDCDLPVARLVAAYGMRNRGPVERVDPVRRGAPHDTMRFRQRRREEPNATARRPDHPPAHPVGEAGR